MSEPVEFAPLTGNGAVDDQAGAPLHRLQDVPVELTVEIGRTHMTIAETLKLGPGSIVSLNRLAGEPVDLLVNGKLIARGEVVVIDEEFGLRLTDVVSAAERPSEIEAVGPTPLATPTVDPALLADDDIAAYLGGSTTPTAEVAAEEIGAPAEDVGAPVGDDDVAAYLGGFADGASDGDPFATTAGAGDPFATTAEAGDPFAPAGEAGDPFGAPDAADPLGAPAPAHGDAIGDPFAEVPGDQLVSPHDDAPGAPLDDDDDVAAYLGGTADEPPAGEASGWVIEGDDEDPLAGLESGPGAG